MHAMTFSTPVLSKLTVLLHSPEGAFSVFSEYKNLDQTLDEIDSWMTKLEQQNDTLYSELEDLLQSSRQARMELQQQQEQDLLEKQITDSQQNDQNKNSENS